MDKMDKMRINDRVADGDIQHAYSGNHNVIAVFSAAELDKKFAPGDDVVLIKKLDFDELLSMWGEHRWLGPTAKDINGQ